MVEGKSRKVSGKKKSKEEAQEGQTADRGRSKKRKSTKAKKSKNEPFSHIASQLIPAAAFATAIPHSAKVISKSRSPSPIARALAFTGKIGSTIAGGRILTRSLSEQQLSKTNQPQVEIALSKAISKSHPGPSTMPDDVYNDEDDDDDDEADYECVRDIRGRAFARKETKDDDTSPISKRPPMPLPMSDKDETDAKPFNTEDLYSKVIKHTTVGKAKEEVKEVSNDDSDDITSVSDMDEDPSSRLGISRHNSKSTKRKQTDELQVDETNDGPSEGEIYRLPYDHVQIHDRPNGKTFETIEEYSEEDASLKSKNMHARSPSASILTGDPAKRRTESSQSITSDQENPSSRPQTPREMGREAAIKRLEELGFDGMNKEIGFYSSLDVHLKSRVPQQNNSRHNQDINESFAEVTEADLNESSPAEEFKFSNLRKRFENGNVVAPKPKNKRVVVEEPLMSSDNVVPAYASEELRLDDLKDAGDDYEHPVANSLNGNTVVVNAKEAGYNDREQVRDLRLRRNSGVENAKERNDSDVTAYDDSCNGNSVFESVKQPDVYYKQPVAASRQGYDHHDNTVFEGVKEAGVYYKQPVDSRQGYDYHDNTVLEGVKEARGFEEPISNSHQGYNFPGNTVSGHVKEAGDDDEHPVKNSHRGSYHHGKLGVEIANKAFDDYKKSVTGSHHSNDYHGSTNVERAKEADLEYKQPEPLVNSHFGNSGIGNVKEATKHFVEAGQESSSNGDVIVKDSAHQQNDVKMVEAEMTKMMQTTGEELKRQRDLQKVVLDNQAKIQEQMYGLYDSISRNTADVIDARHQSRLQQQLDVQDEMERNQERLLEKISALEAHLKDIATQSINTKSEEGNQELLELRRMILKEQKKYIEHQKLVEQQQRKILKTQQSYSPRPKSRSHSNLSLSSPSSPHKAKPIASPRVAVVEQPVQFVLLENRLKAVEAERQALIDLNASMLEENGALKKMALQYDDSGTSEIIYRKQNEDLIQTNENLKKLVHRLNIELSRFQAKYRPPRKEEVEGLSLPEKDSAPHWLVNTKYLSPLILAFDDRLKDKNELIRAYELQLASFKTRMLEIVRENQTLHLMNNEKADVRSSVTLDEWNLLQEQARLVVEENSILMQEIDLKDKRIEELQKDFQSEASTFSKQMRMLENEKNQTQRNLTNLQFENESLKKKYEDTVNESTKKISEEEFRSKLKSTERHLSSDIRDLKRANEDADIQLQAVCKEKQVLAVKLTDANVKNSELNIELQLMSKALRKYEKQLNTAKRKFEESREKEIMATKTLSQVLSVAEKNAKDCDKLSKMVRTQNAEQSLNSQMKQEDELKFDILQNHLKKYKKLSKQKEAEVNQRIKEKDLEMENMRNSHDKEIEDLKEMIRERQTMVDLVQLQERQFENEIDTMWRSVANENEQLKKSI